MWGVPVRVPCTTPVRASRLSSLNKAPLLCPGYRLQPTAYQPKCSSQKMRRRLSNEQATAQTETQGSESAKQVGKWVHITERWCEMIGRNVQFITYPTFMRFFWGNRVLHISLHWPVTTRSYGGHIRAHLPEQHLSLSAVHSPAGGNWDSAFPLVCFWADTIESARPDSNLWLRWSWAGWRVEFELS